MNSYPDHWSELAQAVKDADGWHCVRCSHEHSREGWHILTVHHLDGDKSNCRWWNLAALCQRCHLHIQAKVVMSRVWMFEHSDWFRPYVAGYYAFQYGLPHEDRAWVEAHAGELIDVGQGRAQPGDVELMRYTYLGTAATRPELVGLPCDTMRRHDGKCILSTKMASALVVDAEGNRHVMARRRLRLNSKLNQED